MERDKTLTEELVRFSSKIGIDTIGFGDPIHFSKYEKKYRPDYYQKEVKTVIVVGIKVFDIILDAWTTEELSGKNFHFLDTVLENRLLLIKDFLIEKDFNSVIIPYKPGLYLKDAAAIAGIGSIGKHNLLISEEFGSQIRLRAMVTNAPLLTGIPNTNKQFCEECNLCVKACPANAINTSGYDKQACLEYNLSNLKKISKDTVLWCNVCLDTCPVPDKRSFMPESRNS